ncbi:VOC family protein [Priestia endophytica]|uniref:VOC family protein n=1 Tax=Priestia endophytica TaxID=135735 RepID=UPI000F548749|nr:VOC family protein [Priestia endophytica]MED4072085.1 VOC family protein [Priestia endophytica]RPK10961.1 hypothetical protein FH5_04039 [Priestia endophytica]
MIKGIYEAHLPVKDLENSIDFYKRLGLELAWRDESTAFFWIDKGRSWLGLWEGDEYKTPYHPALRHIAFEVTYEDLKTSVEWLNTLGIKAGPVNPNQPIDPFIRPNQGNGTVYFNDPDGNSLELMCYVEVPEHLRHITNKLSFSEWEELLMMNK